MPYVGNTYKIPCTGGLNFNPNYDYVPMDAMVDADNVNLHNGGREPRGGCEILNDTAITDEPKIMGMYQFLREDGSLVGFYLVDEYGDNIGDEYGNMIVSESVDIVVGTSDGKIYKNFDTELKDGLSLNRRYNFEVYYDELYISNGEDVPQVWGESLAYTWDMGSPIKCTAVLGTGAGNVDDGTHSYKITFVTDSGESTGGVVSDVVTVVDHTTNGVVELTDIPLGKEGTTARKIYRTVAGDTGSYLLVDTLSDNTTTSYQDDIADASLTDAEPSYSLAFLPSDWVNNYPKYFIIHGRNVNKRLWAFGCEGTPSYIYASKNAVADFSDENVVAIKVMCPEITGAVEFGGNLILFSANKSYIVNDTSLTIASWGYSSAVWEGGAAHHNLIVKTPTDVMVMSEDGNIFSISAAEQYGDYKIASLSRPVFIHKWIEENIDILKIDKFHAVYDNYLRAIKIFMVANGEDEPNICLVYFIDQGAWTKHSFSSYFLCSAIVRVTLAQWKIYVGDDSGTGYSLESSTLLDDETSYTSNFKTPPIPLDNQRSHKRFDRVWLVMKPRGTETMDAEVTIDNRTLTTEYSVTMTEEQDFLENYPFHIGASGKRLQVDISNDGEENYFISQLMVDAVDSGAA